MDGPESYYDVWLASLGEFNCDRVMLLMNRIPSNRMPRIPSASISLTGWLILIAMAAAMLSLIYRTPWLILFLAVIFLVMYIAFIPASRRLDRLAKSRADDSICTFVRQFDYRETDTWILRAVYEEIIDCVGFPIHADDNLVNQLKIDHEDLDDAVFDIAERAGRSMDNAGSNPYFNRVKTVADLVLFLEHQPRKNAA